LSTGLRICLAASGGGHVRQLLDLEPAFLGHDVFFVTEDTALGRSLPSKYRLHYVPHFALGQARLGAPFRMLRAAAANFLASARIILKERPDVLISTGAGAVYFTVLWARLLGAKIILIESFARFTSLSAFAKIAHPLAHYGIVQSAALKDLWPKAMVFDPLKIQDTGVPQKQDLLFATVGATLPFDRLVATVAKAVEKGDIIERVIIQTGEGGLTPPGLDTSETFPFHYILDLLKDAKIVVCHGGTGSLITALRNGCIVIAMPRLFALGEHYDDHQSDIIAAFSARGLILVANSQEEMSTALARAREMSPVVATTDHSELVAYLRGKIDDIADGLASRRPRR
jgi:UDP-N-acetylglucosamine--N-acetylmuramyl-(pentapeptide) pyrophosphoryl-undecaprenol N-acetylglucosamine transferase